MTIDNRVRYASKVLSLAAATFALAPAVPATADTLGQTAWISTWMASPQPVWDEGFAFPSNIPSMLQDQTIRQIARISLGGKRMRIVLSNEYGASPLSIDTVHIGLAGQGAEVLAGTDRVVTFGGRANAVVSAGAPLVSDPVDLKVSASGRVSVSLYLRDQTLVNTFHWDGRQTAYLVQGDQTASRVIDPDSTTTARIFLSGIQVETDTSAQSVVAIGDSITDGNGATVDADARWPDFLATRLAPRGVAVLNAGISGARLLGDRMGVNALARFDRDVLSQPRVKAVVVLLGINDISWPGTVFEPDGVRPTVDALVAGYRQLIARAHARGLRIVAGTLTPFEGALPDTPLEDYYQKDKDAMRRQVNAWIRTSGEFDAVVDFDALVRNPEHPSRFQVEFDSGDHLHPGDRGSRAMADAIDLDQLLGSAMIAPLTIR